MKKQKQSFFILVCGLAIPVALQSMLQSSFSMIDQIMIGQLGSIQVAGVGLAGKFSSIYSVLVSAIGAVAGIMISQYLGQDNSKEVGKSFYLNLLLSLLLSVLFTALCVLFPRQIMGLYTKDEPTLQAAAAYLAIISGTFLPLAGATLLSTLLRCMEKAQLPLYSSIASALMNTVLNYIFIFGKWGFSPMGSIGAAVATLLSQWFNCLLLLLFVFRLRREVHLSSCEKMEIFSINWAQYSKMLFPIFICELLWSLGENVYAIIYGHLGTDSMAAMTLINPIQGLMIGALCGLSQAASIIIGKKLGSKEYEEAYHASWKLILYGLVGSLLLSCLILATKSYYVRIYQVEDTVKTLTMQILTAYALVAPFKVLNMILGGGIIRSGGKTTYVMLIDAIGTWGFGVPLGLLSAFLWNLSIPYVYFLLSLEECVRFVLSLVVLRSRKWMHSIS